VAVSLRLGSKICQPYHCVCGALVDTHGSHALSYKRNPGLSQRYHFINHLIWRALSKVKPHGRLRSDNKRPDVSLLFHGAMVGALSGTSLLLTLWRPLTWAYHLLEATAKLKEDKYTEIACLSCLSLPSRHSVLLIRSVLTSSLLWAIAFHHSLWTRERHFFFSNVFLLRFNGLLLSDSPIHSAKSMRKCDVASWDSSCQCFFSTFTTSYAFENDAPNVSLDGLSIKQH